MSGLSVWRKWMIVGAAALTTATVGACDQAGPSEAQAQGLLSSGGREIGTGGLYAFRSDAELREFLQRRRPQRPRYDGAGQADMANASPPPPTAAPSAAPTQAESRAAGGEPSITNNQEQGVDEGGIVKNRGDLLIVLRRGRVFTIDTSGGRMRRVDVIDAFPPGTSGQGAWYDEMLVAGDRVVVIGYSYERGGTEIVRFRLGRDGQLDFDDAYHLKGNDYYSSRNYASRLVGNRLVTYSPLHLWRGGEDPLDALPGLRRWTGNRDAEFERIADARRIYVPPSVREADTPITALHTLISCDLLAATLDCDAQGVLGPDSRSFYVSGRAIYLWLTASDTTRGRGTPAAFVYRLPLSGAEPSAASVRGAPTDQFSFREDARDEVLNVLVRSSPGGDAMLGPEFSDGAVALLRLPLQEFGAATQEVPAARYRVLPKPAAGYEFQNRFVGDWVLYGVDGSGEYGYEPGERRSGGRLIAAPVRGGEPREFDLRSTIARIEPIGPDAVVVGDAGEDLMFTPVTLRRGAALGEPYILPSATQGETRSHGFFFRPSDGDGNGVLALPVAKPAPERLASLLGRSASILFLAREGGGFDPLGELEANASGAVQDACVASCTDWYGNARPIFLRDRVFALLGYELVEGAIRGRGIREIGRLDFAPNSPSDGYRPPNGDGGGDGDWNAPGKP